MKDVIKQTKKKHIKVSANLQPIKDLEADVVAIPFLKQVTITFSFPSKEAAQEFFDSFV